jgi:hypothetical protein
MQLPHYERAMFGPAFVLILWMIYTAHPTEGACIVNAPTSPPSDENHPADPEALVRELGLVGMIRYFQQGNTGSGDYTAERHAWLDGISIEELVAMAKELRQQDTEAQR